MKTRAAVAWEAGKPLEVLEIDLEGPREGEVLIRNVATGVCHTDAYTLSGADPEGIFLESPLYPWEITSSHSTLQNAGNVNSALQGKQTFVRPFAQPRDKD